MGALRVLIAAAALALASPVGAKSVTYWQPYVDEASARFGVPTQWIEAVMRAESRGRTTLNGRPIRSSAGAMGLMQLMPGTWADMRARLGLGSDPDDPRANILAGTFYLRLMYDRFGYPGLFAAYNAGPARYAAHLSGRARLPRETVGYLAAVAPNAFPVTQMQARPKPPATLFAVRRDGAAEAREAPGEPPISPLFIALSQGN